MLIRRWHLNLTVSESGNTYALPRPFRSRLRARLTARRMRRDLRKVRADERMTVSISKTR